jgi:hypothetical protein
MGMRAFLWSARDGNAFNRCNFALEDAGTVSGAAAGPATFDEADKAVD